MLHNDVKHLFQTVDEMKARFGEDVLSAVSFVIWNCTIGLIQEGFLACCEHGS